MPDSPATARDALLTANQAAEHLNVPTSSIMWLCRTKQIAYAVVAGKRRFRRQDLDRYVREHVVEAVP